MANDTDRQAANKLRLEAEFYEVPGLGLIQDFFGSLFHGAHLFNLSLYSNYPASPHGK